MTSRPGPHTEAGKAASARNATKHGLTCLHPVVTAADRPDFDALHDHLHRALQPATDLQHLTFDRLLNAAWNMQRCLKLEHQLLATAAGADPLGHPDVQKQAALFQRYYLRFEGSYRANLRELERLQRLQLAQDAYFGDQHPAGELHDVQLYQRLAKRTRPPATPAPKPPQNPQPPSNQPTAKQIPRSAPCPCGSGQKYKRCCGVNAPPVLHAA